MQLRRISRSDRDKPKLFGDLALCFVSRGERPWLAGLQQRRNDDGCDCQMPGVHRTQRMLAYELQGVLLNLVLWRTEHDHRAREVAVQQREQALLITAACARGP